MADTGQRTEYAELTAEELEKRLREVFFYPDTIDETVFRELETLREALEKKRPVEEADPEEAWQRFLEDRSEELSELFSPESPKPAEPRRRLPGPRAMLRRVLVAAAVILLLAGAALAADSLGLRVWSPRWNDSAGRYVLQAREASAEGTVLAALRELEITEPVYPAKLPEGFVITESRISKDPLVLMEQYARGDKRLSLTITPLKGFETSLYQPDGESARAYAAGRAVHYMFRSEGTVTAVWCTEHYAVSVSGNLSLNEIRRIIDSVYASPEGGHRS